MAKAYREGAGWAFRVRIKGQSIYRSGFKSKRAAQKAANGLTEDLEQADKPARLGPERTAVGQALSDYAMEMLPSHKGAEQEARRINRYLRALNLPLLKVVAVDGESGTVKASMRPEERGEKAVHFKVLLEAAGERVIPNSLREHRAKLQAEGLGSDTLRSLLARTMVADVSVHRLQAFVKKLEEEGCGMSTVRLEVAVLRQMFNHARRIWQWDRPKQNPASGLKIATQDNKRTRTLSEEEWIRIAPVLARSGNPCVFPLVCLMLETAMRSSEPLTRLRWQDVDWDERVLQLSDGKNGKREVPLGPAALDILRGVQRLGLTSAPEQPVFPTTYEALKKAWRVARKEAGIENIQLHDLRHTAATRYSFEFHGNTYLLKVVTGHKTAAMLDRYVNITAKQVATLMHGEALGPNDAPAGLHSDVVVVSRQAHETAAKVKQVTRDRVARQQSLRRQAQEARKAGRPWPTVPVPSEEGAGAPPPSAQGVDDEMSIAATSNVVRWDFRKKAA